MDVVPLCRCPCPLHPPDQQAAKARAEERAAVVAFVRTTQRWCEGELKATLGVLVAQLEDGTHRRRRT